MTTQQMIAVMQLVKFASKFCNSAALRVDVIELQASLRVDLEQTQNK